jgi:hypothetical protein
LNIIALSDCKHFEPAILVLWTKGLLTSVSLGLPNDSHQDPM